MTTEPEASEDYGYDLAHEAQEAHRIPVARRREAGEPVGSGSQVDQDGDLGYDDAHEIPASDRPYRT